MMRGWIGGLALSALLMLGGCNGSDPIWEISQWGCAVGDCLPDAPSGHQCFSKDVDGDLWLARAADRDGALNAAQRLCALNSNAPASCFVVPNDCLELFSYCPGGAADSSANCRLYGPPGAAEAPQKG